MLPSTKNQVSTSQPFKLLVGHYAKSSDPSKGEVGNPDTIRHGFETQTVQTSLGTGVLGKVGSNRTQLIIKVNSTEYGNENVVQAPPFYDVDTILVYSGGLTDNPNTPVLQAGFDFGVAQGNGQGNVSDVASSLAVALTDNKMGISSIVDPADNTQVIVTSSYITDTLTINIKSLSYNLFNGNPPFIIKDIDGTILFDPVVNQRSSASIIKRSNALNPMVQLV